METLNRASIATTEDPMELIDFLVECRHDPLQYALAMYPWGVEGTELANHSLRDWQRQALDRIGKSLRDDPFLTVRECFATGHGVGKSALVGIITDWGLDTCIGAKIVVTANTEAQLKLKTWAEMAKWHNLRLTKDYWKYGKTSLHTREPDLETTWRADMTPWSEQNSEAFAGLHNEGKRIILIFDEASAIPEVIWETAEGAMTDANTEIIWLAFGNPTRNTGRFRECFPGGKFAKRWNSTSLDARTIEGVDKEQLNDWVEDYGEDSDFVRVRVRGVFPRTGDRQFIGSDLVNQAIARPAERQATDPVVMGVDVARYGMNETVICIRAGFDAKSIKWIKLRNLSATQCAARIMEQIQKHKPDACFIDADGIGGPVYDIIRDLRYRQVFAVNSGKAAYASNEYANLRAEMWGKMRKWLERGQLPEDKALRAQLIGPEYDFTNKNQIKLEKKEDMEKRGLESPDRADALALTFAMPVTGIARFPEELQGVRRQRREYDPLAQEL
jgi:hypothetical protein